jgi:DNA-binding transcriptional LysR family regulator
MGADQLADRARALKGGQTGTLKVAATPHVIAGVLAAFLRHFCGRYPSVEVRLVEGGAASQSARLHSGEVHLALMPFGDGTVDGQLLYPVYGLAVLSDKHPLSARSVLDVSELCDEPVLLLQRGFGSRAWFDAASEIEHFKPRIRLESAAPETLVELAAAQYGVAIVPSTVIMRGRGIRVLPLVQRGAALGRWSMVGWAPRRHLPAYAERFVDELSAYVRVTFPGRDFVKHAPPLPRPRHPDTSNDFHGDIGEEGE